jgi:hypothetical protein
VVGDTAYGNVEARELLEQRSVQVLAPVHSSSPKDRAIPKERFGIALETDTVTCPRGHTTPIYKPRANRRTTSGERVAPSRESTVSRARSGSGARREGSETSGSAAARTSAKPRYGRCPTPPNAST